MMKPLLGLKVIDFSQFLAGPACSLRLADLGAEVIKVERPSVGDICRQLYVAKQKIGDESTIFHAINRNKKSVTIDLKSEAGHAIAIGLIKDADVVIQNFRPGVAKKLGIDFDTLKQHNSSLVYGSVSGYGTSSKSWYHKPGQDLLAQSLSGLVWSNSKVNEPIPMGLAIADLSAAYDLTQGILSLLVRRGKTKRGGYVEVSLFESLISLQAQPILERLNHITCEETNDVDASGLYKVKDGYIAIGTIEVQCLYRKLNIPLESSRVDFTDLLKTNPREHWIIELEKLEISVTSVLDWHELRASEHYKALDFEQNIFSQNNVTLATTRCPIKIDGERYRSPVGAPAIGEHNDLILGNKICS